jgi:hypothetical protein
VFEWVWLVLLSVVLGFESLSPEQRNRVSFLLRSRTEAVIEIVFLDALKRDERRNAGDEEDRARTQRKVNRQTVAKLHSAAPSRSIKR